DQDQREGLRDVLAGEGYAVDVAEDGMDAVRKFVALMPEVVLMDLSLPNMDGCDAIRELRRRGDKRRPYVIAVSARADAESRKTAFEAGCNEYIAKPLDVL